LRPVDSARATDADRVDRVTHLGRAQFRRWARTSAAALDALGGGGLFDQIDAPVGSAGPRAEWTHQTSSPPARFAWSTALARRAKRRWSGVCRGEPDTVVGERDVAREDAEIVLECMCDQDAIEGI